jgi:hypothetical protein
MESKTKTHASGGFSDLFEAQINEPEQVSKENSQSPSTNITNGSPALLMADAGEEEWLTGYKLTIIMVALTLAAFLMLLDTSIVATVGPESHLCSVYPLTTIGNSADYK